MMLVTHNAEDGKRFPYSNPPCSWYCVDLEDDVDPGQYCARRLADLLDPMISENGDIVWSTQL